MCTKASSRSIAIVCWLTIICVNAALAQQQNRPAAPVVTNPAVNIPGAYPPNMPLNTIRTWDAIGPVTNPNAVMSGGYQQSTLTTKYFNGPSRVLQTVVRQATPDAKDLVTPVEYDAFGRESNKYLQYGSAEYNGLFKTDPFNAQYAFMRLQYPDDKIFFSHTEFESSPQNRKLKIIAPGNSWGGNNKGISKDHLINKDGDGVRIWNITNNPLTYSVNDVNLNIPTAQTDPYTPGKLTKTVTKDENDNVVIEYKNKEDQVVLKKVQAGTVPGDYTGHDHFLCTYFVYDDLSRLRFIIPPAAVEAIKVNWTLTAEVVDELCFRYEYDVRNRMIAKKNPGADWVYMVYDMRDRLVFTQDARMRGKNQWLTSLYDGLNRTVMTGILEYSGGPVALQQSVTANTVSPTAPQPGLEIDIQLYEPTSGTKQATNSITMLDGFVTPDNTSFLAEIISSIEETAIQNVSVNKNPIPAGANFIPLSKTFYDNYDWTDKTYTTAYNNYLDAGNNQNVVAMPSQAFMQVKGQVTGTQVKVIEDPANLSAGNWLTTVNFYDDHLRVIQTYSENKKGRNITTNRYNFTGKVVCSYIDHNNPGATPASVKIKTNMEYDHGGRLLEVWKTINDDNSKKALISKNSYNELGQLKKKQLGRQKNDDGSYTATPVEILNYDYNMRKWLTGINKDYANGGGAVNGVEPWFGMELNYDRGFQVTQLNGNIAGTKWRSKGDAQQRAYGYTYDNASRLLGADFTQYNGSDYADDDIVRFDVQVGDGQTYSQAYDANGNIQSLKQWGLKVNHSEVIDDMEYKYYDYSNKLSRVNERNTGAADHKLGDFTDNNTNGDDYGYDANGNLVTDRNKRINGTPGRIVTSGGAIIYNHLNLPREITIKDQNDNLRGTITYVYDASANRLQKIVFESNATVRYNDVDYNTSITTTTSYLGGFVYEIKVFGNSALSALGYTDLLQFFSHEEGRARYLKTANAFEYDYFIKDNIDNVRMVLTEEHAQDIYPAATLEGDLSTASDAAYIEKQYYSIQPANVVDKSVATGISNYQNNNGAPPYNNNPNSKTTENSNKIYKLIAANIPGGGATGLGVTLKVMSGDKVNVFGKSYYFQNNTGGDNYAIPVVAIIDGMFGTPGGVAGSKGVTAGDVNGQSALTALIGDYLTNPRRNENGTDNTPRAYINWMLLDENFKYVDGSFDRVGSANIVKSHAINEIPVTKNGYMYVYVSNESPVNVFFDNLQVIHTRGALLEETHYYPFGLTMKGISTKAAGALANKKKFTSQDLDDELDWNVYQFRYRNMDPQIGRFLQMDPLSTKYPANSTFAYAENKVTAGIDLEGLELLPFNTGWFRFMSQEIKGAAPFMNTWQTYVDVVASNVHSLFKDDSGNPLFSAASVNVGPNGRILTGQELGPQLLPGNNLPPPTRVWTWDQGWGLQGVPSKLYSSSSGRDYYAVDGGVGSVGYSGSNAGTKGNTALGAYKEVKNWAKLYVEDLPNWNAYNSLSDNSAAVYTAVELVNRYSGTLQTQLGDKYNTGLRNDLINFMVDGNLPLSYGIDNLKGSVENTLLVLWYGIQILNLNNYSVNGAAYDDFESYLSTYKTMGPYYNFDPDILYNKK